jgi:nicotinamidase/pyrazinamidase
MNQVLMIVDLQRDFCPGGALAAPRGNEVVPVINRLMDRFQWIVASKDWHPAQTAHFDKWPPHCVRGTVGAAFHPDLDEQKISTVALKGTGESDDGYSAFEATNMDLIHWLRKNSVDALYITGIATEYCVKATALDTLKAGFDVTVITDAVAAVDVHTGDHEKALQEMDAAGVKLISSSQL